MYEYKCENITGNFHSLVFQLNDPNCEWIKNGWELVTAEMTGRYTVAIFKRLRKS